MIIDFIYLFIEIIGVLLIIFISSIVLLDLNEYFIIFQYVQFHFSIA
jgi:hypothetical protein